MTLPLATLRADPANDAIGYVRVGDRVIGSVQHQEGRGWSWNTAEASSGVGHYYASAEEAAECVAEAWGTRLEDADCGAVHPHSRVECEGERGHGGVHRYVGGLDTEFAIEWEGPNG